MMAPPEPVNLALAPVDLCRFDHLQVFRADRHDGFPDIKIPVDQVPDVPVAG